MGHYALTAENRTWLAALPQGPVLVDDLTEMCHGTPFDEDVYVYDDVDALRDVWRALPSPTEDEGPTPMTLQPGTRLGPYEITAQIGVGGMGEVYRATDTKLKREVAVKVLPASLASEPERLARFQREAEVLASLNHPNIAAIYGLEEADQTKALAMELVEGPTLADRVKQGAIPIDEALPIAKQIAEVLEAAHDVAKLGLVVLPSLACCREACRRGAF